VPVAIDAAIAPRTRPPGRERKHSRRAFLGFVGRVRIMGLVDLAPTGADQGEAGPAPGSAGVALSPGRTGTRPEIHRIYLRFLRLFGL